MQATAQQRRRLSCSVIVGDGSEHAGAYGTSEDDSGVHGMRVWRKKQKWQVIAALLFAVWILMETRK